jgi:hypothetical protein
MARETPRKLSDSELEPHPNPLIFGRSFFKSHWFDSYIIHIAPILWGIGVLVTTARTLAIWQIGRFSPLRMARGEFHVMSLALIYFGLDVRRDEFERVRRNRVATGLMSLDGVARQTAASQPYSAQGLGEEILLQLRRLEVERARRNGVAAG